MERASLPSLSFRSQKLWHPDHQCVTWIPTFLVSNFDAQIAKRLPKHPTNNNRTCSRPLQHWGFFFGNSLPHRYVWTNKLASSETGDIYITCNPSCNHGTSEGPKFHLKPQSVPPTAIGKLPWSWIMPAVQRWVPCRFEDGDLFDKSGAFRKRMDFLGGLKLMKSWGGLYA